MVKVTFTLDAETVSTLRRSAERLRRPQSAVVRDAIADYAERIGRLSGRERAQMLRVLDGLASAPPTRSARAVDAELREVRASRRAAGIARDRARR